MEEKKKIKISLTTVVLLIVAILICAATIVFILLQNNNENSIADVNNKPISSGDYKEVSTKGKTYYQRTSENTWNGEYQHEVYYTKEKINSTMDVVSYQEYLEIIDTINSISTNKIAANYSKDKGNNYIILSYANGYSWCEMEVIDCIEENDKIIIYGNEDVQGVMADGSGYFIAIPTNMPIGTKIEYRECYSSQEIDNIKRYGTPEDPSSAIDYKPIIYFYPTQDTKVSVKLLKDDNITCSYPKYQNGWDVLAKKDGDLIDLKNNRTLYSLYYECNNQIDYKIENEGFIVKGEDSAKFLEEKLDILGLNQREAEEFIIYWLPKLEDNKYNYIRFATADEINENMPLEINPNPDTIIRVLMTFKGLDSPISVQEQQLKTPSRNGFVVVEWGGTEIK